MEFAKHDNRIENAEKEFNEYKRTLRSQNNFNRPGEKRIIKLELGPAIYPAKIEVGKVYIIKNEVVLGISQSATLAYIYTETSGINYGTPICIPIPHIERTTYVNGR